MATQYPDVAAAAAASTSSLTDDSPTSSSSPTTSSVPLPTAPMSQNPPATPTTPAAASGRKKAGSVGADTRDKRPPVTAMPVFGAKPLYEFKGHEADVLDLSWSKVSRNEESSAHEFRS